MAQPASKRLVTEERLAQSEASTNAQIPTKVATEVTTQMTTPGSNAQKAMKTVVVDTTLTVHDPLGPWEAALASRNIGGPARILYMGSSTTFGSNSTNPSLKYTQLLLERIQAAYPGAQPGYEKPLVNTATNYPTRDERLGVQGYVSAAGGLTSANYYNSTNGPFITWQRPNLVVHAIGANDALADPAYNVPLATFQANVANAVDAIAAGVPFPVSQMLVHQHRRVGISVATWAAYGDRLRAVAATRPNVLYVDLSAAFERLDLAGTNPLVLMDTDGSHLTDSGHAYLAELMAQALRVPSTVGLDPKARVVDTFTRPNGPAVAAETGQPWERLGATVEAISGRTLTFTTGGTLVTESGMADLEVEGQVAYTGGSPLPGIVFRCSTDTNRMGLFINPVANLVMLYKTEAGVTTVLQQVTRAFAAGTFHLKARVVGDRVWGYVNGVKFIDYTLTSGEMTAFGGLTKVGFRQGVVVAGTAFHGFRARRP